MHVSRTGLTPVKGGRHTTLPAVDLSREGPVGDRVFCLVDRDRGRVLRTVENPSLLRTSARWDGEVLTATLPTGTATGVPEPTGETVKVDYWGRVAALDVVDGPWAAAWSQHLGREVTLARAVRPGEVVYGAPVSLVTTSTLAEVERRGAGTVDDAQLRATFTLDTGEHPAHVEDTWVGRRLALGDAEVEVRGRTPRCAVVDLDPDTGVPRSRVLRVLGGYRRHEGEVVLGVDAVVVRPGRVETGAPAVVERG